jgi:hypothetical protein
VSEQCNAFLRPLKKKGFTEERGTTMRLDDLGTSTTLASTKSQALTQRRALLTQRQELLADCSVLRLEIAVCFDALISRLRHIGIGSAEGLR